RSRGIVDRVAAAAAIIDVVAVRGRGADDVAAVAAMDDVHAEAAGQDIVAGAAFDTVRPGGSGEDVAEAAAENREAFALCAQVDGDPGERAGGADGLDGDEIGIGRGVEAGRGRGEHESVVARAAVDPVRPDEPDDDVVAGS